MEPKLAVERVTVERAIHTDGRWTRLRVLTEVSFTVPAGGRLAIFGPSGAGKSSLLRLLNRLDEPADGRVLLDGIDMRDIDPIALRRRVGMVFQQPFLFDMTVEENLGYPLQLLGQTLPRAQAGALLEEFGLSADHLDRHAQQLSGGQQQRVALARALTLNPEVLLLDEPSSALDERSAGIMMDALLARSAVGLTVVMVTHAREMLRRLACPALLVHDGHVHAYPDPDTAISMAAREQVEME